MSGRPFIDDKRDYMFHLRLNSKEKEILDKICKMESRSRSEIIRTTLNSYYDELIKKENNHVD